MRQVIPFTTEAEWLRERAKDLTSTECASLFNINPYCTIFELWYQKKEVEVIELTESGRMLWGKRLQDVIAHGVAQDLGWKIQRMDEYIRIPDLRIGSSFDFSVEEIPLVVGCDTSEEKGILEVKNVDSLIFRSEWIKNDNGTYEAPPHIELQLQHQLLVSGRTYGFIVCLVGGNQIIVIKRQAEPSIHEAIKTKVAEFWESIEKGIEPKPDFTRDSKMISRLYGVAEPGKIYSAEGDDEMLEIVKEYVTLTQQIKKMDARKNEIKANILETITDSEKVVSPDFSITCGEVGPTHVEYDRDGFRMFRINPKKHIEEEIESEVWLSDE